MSTSLFDVRIVKAVPSDTCSNMTLLKLSNCAGVGLFRNSGAGGGLSE